MELIRTGCPPSATLQRLVVTAVRPKKSGRKRKKRPTLAEDAVRTVAIFDAAHENPELIWNAPMRTELRAALSHLSSEALLAQQREPPSAYALPADFKVEYPQLDSLLCIGGVYIHQLLKQPAWQLRDPRWRRDRC